MLRIPFTPIIAHRVRKDIPRTIKGCARNCAPGLWITLQSVLGIFIPEVKGPVRASGAEGAVYWVEAYCVDAINVADVALRGGRLTVAFEAEVGSRIFVFDVLDCAAPFYATNCEAAGVGEARHNARLPFEGGLHCFVELRRFAQVDDVDVAICGSNDE